jgi:hydroxyacylglutathione hydrolase
MDYVQEVLPHLFLVDVEHFGEAGLGGAYILLGEGEAALVDTGPSLARDRILGALEFLGIPRAMVRWIFLTHIHLDHAGGAGVLVPELPKARVVVHPRGVKHLVDPSRLLFSTQSATGPRFRFYGTAVPIPEERLLPASDGETLRLGSQEVRVIDAPGHAPHHLCFFLPGAGLLFTGDAVGLYLKGRLLPTTVPPNFDLELWLSTLDRLSALRPQKLLFAHFGPGEADLIGEYKKLLLAWVERVRRHKGAPEEDAIAAILGELREEGWPVGPGVSGDWTMSVRGVLLYLRRQEASG